MSEKKQIFSGLQFSGCKCLVDVREERIDFFKLLERQQFNQGMQKDMYLENTPSLEADRLQQQENTLGATPVG